MSCTFPILQYFFLEKSISNELLPAFAESPVRKGGDECEKGIHRSLGEGGSFRYIIPDGGITSFWRTSNAPYPCRITGKFRGISEDRRNPGNCSLILQEMGDKNSVSLGRNIGDSGLVCQGQTWHIMLRARGLRWTKAFRAGIARHDCTGEGAPRFAERRRFGPKRAEIILHVACRFLGSWQEIRQVMTGVDYQMHGEGLRGLSSVRFLNEVYIFLPVER
jgi:hypothetical protein